MQKEVQIHLAFKLVQNVLGIPRGEVVTADIIAQKHGASFDILIPRKIAAPHNEELVIGAVMKDGMTYLNEELIDDYFIRIHRLS